MAVLCETGKLVLSDDPAAALAANAALRRADAPDGAGSDLWSPEQVGEAAAGCAYTFPVPTFASKTWPSHLQPSAFSTHAYRARFSLKYPVVQKILPMPGVFVAGGAAMWPFATTGSDPSDVDLFIAGAGDELWARAGEVMRRLFLAARAADRACTFCRTLSAGVLTALIFWENDTVLKVQVILRDYRSVSSTLHGFDIPSCAVAYDGNRVALTSLAAYAHVFQVNLVEPAYRSATFEVRLAKYFERGFALGLVHAEPDLFADRPHLTPLAHLSLAAEMRAGCLARGKVVLNGAEPESDYDPIGCRREFIYPSQVRHCYSATGTANYNVKQLLQGSDRFIQMSVEDAEPIPRPLPTFSEICPLDFFEANLSKIIRNRFLFIPLDKIVRILRTAGCNSAEMVTIFSDYFVKSSAPNFDASEFFIQVLTSHFEHLRAKYLTLATTSIAWVVAAPENGQFSASLRPLVETPAQWYGPAAGKAMAGASAADAGAADASAADAGAADASAADASAADASAADAGAADASAADAGAADASAADASAADAARRAAILAAFSPRPLDDCPLCLEALSPADPGLAGPGPANLCILCCGHAMHLGPDKNCSGILGWISHNSCPVCRQEF